MNFIKSSILVILTMTTFHPSPENITVYLIGDSTMYDKKMTAYPETGWGMPFKFFFDSTVKVDNRARNGRSTRSFISENLWQPVADNLKEGDYVFIQFGHNDESKEKGDRYTTPEQYKSNLLKFITETRAKKANPVLLTPVSRRKFKEGKVQETHKEYSPLVMEIAAQQNVPLIDMDVRSRELLQKIGEDPSKLLFVQLAPGEHPNYPEGRIDNTHFSELGARLMAQIVLSEIKSQKMELAERIVKPAVKK